MMSPVKVRAVTKRRLVGTSFEIAMCIALASSPALPQPSGSYIITTVAGQSPGSTVPALTTELSFLGAVALDASGNIFIADTGHYRVCKVTPQGAITIVAGNGEEGFSGDGGPATSAELDMAAAVFGQPAGLAVDASGNLFIADSRNNRIRKVTPQGIITTIAGTGDSGFDGDGGPATLAKLYQPTGISTDGTGNLFMVDNNRIRKISPQGTIITIAGNGLEGFSGDGGLATLAELLPAGIVVDTNGNLIIADSGNNRIRKVTPQGIITTVAGDGTSGFSGDGGAAISARLSSPTALALDSSGNIFIVDKGNIRIRRVTSQGTIDTIAGAENIGISPLNADGGPGTIALGSGFPAVMGVAVDEAGNVFIGDGYNRIRKLIPAPASTVGCGYSIDQSLQSFTAAGGNGTVGVLTTGNTCPWLAVSYTDWLIVDSPTDFASGLGFVAYRSRANETSVGRNGTLWIGGNALTVNQPGTPCSFNVTPLEIPVGASGVIGTTLNVTASASDCQWGAIASVPWVFVSAGSAVTGSGIVTFTVGINMRNLRSGTITVAGHTVNVHQGARGSCDINGYGITNSADVHQIINEALGVSPAVDDLTSDHTLNVIDVQIVINSALGLSCAVV